MKVRIDAGGREVEIDTLSDTNVSVKDVAAEALTLWQATEGATATSAAFGFSQERRGWQVSPMNMGDAGRRGGWVTEPKAEEVG